MNRYNLISLLGLLLLLLLLPLYSLGEPQRLDQAQAELHQEQIAGGMQIYVHHCLACHGTQGEGIGVMPALADARIEEVSDEYLFRTIARAAHGTTMAAWHIEDGGVLGDFEIGLLVTFLQAADWQATERLALAQQLVPPAPAATEADQVNVFLDARRLMPALLQPDAKKEDMPHLCHTCHEEPEIHADRFGLDCVRCHTLAGWTPALLMLHTFELDHGGEGSVPCQSCHLSSYVEHTCYGCHDHTVAEMAEVHLAEGLTEIESCVSCHPTGREGEGRLYQDGLPPEPAAADYTVGGEPPAPVPDVSQLLLGNGRPPAASRSGK